MKKSISGKNLCLASALLLQCILAVWLVKRSIRSDERLVAAVATIISQQKYIEALRVKSYGAEFHRELEPEEYREIDEIQKQFDGPSLWYEWIRAYGYGYYGQDGESSDGTPRYNSVHELRKLDYAVIPNYAEWIDEADFASDMSRASAALFFNDYLRFSKLDRKLEHIDPIPESKYGASRKFNLPRKK